ncbi:alpha/beta hydrolase [Microtetraspora fusca]|uniref:alpha/beta hydrolase n=1 Tax=Microtetraspora fusca TaxID=1997 RepID=UPI000B088AD1|nr:hypothetical protein [Microtetraspora fusca]
MTEPDARTLPQEHRALPATATALRIAAVAGAAAMPASVVFRDGIWAWLGSGGQPDTTTQLATLTVTGAVATAVLAFGVCLLLTRSAGRGGATRPRRWRSWARRAVNTITVAAFSLVVFSGAYVALVAARHGEPVTLPTPTGPHRIGRATFDWTDNARVDPLAPRPGGARRLSVWLWYPAAPGAKGRPAPYAPGAWGGLHFPGVLGLGESDFAALRTHALQDVPVAEGRFPVVVLEPGLGLAAPQYSTLAENLASHGYLVAGVTPTYSANLTVLDGRAVPATTAGNPPELEAADLHTGRAAEVGDRLVGVWAADARFAAAQVTELGRSGRFAGHVDAAHTAYLGHSFGGAASLEACRTDRHCIGAADLDGTQFGPVVRTGLAAPLMILGSQNSCVTGTCRPATPGGQADRATARTLLSAGTGSASSAQIDGAGHFNFSDYPVYFLAAPLRGLLALGPIDGREGLDVIDARLVAFLDHAAAAGT